VLLGCEHEDGEDEERGKKHFEEDAAGGGDACAEGGGDVEGAWDDGLDYARGGHAREHLGDEAEACSDCWDGADEPEAECYLWVLSVSFTRVGSSRLAYGRVK